MFLQILFLGSIFAHVCPSKLLVSTGAQYDDKGQISEVIDLLDPEAICEPLPDYPVNIEDAFGGLLHGNIPIICGGQSMSGFYQNMQCHTISSDSISIGKFYVSILKLGDPDSPPLFIVSFEHIYYICYRLDHCSNIFSWNFC